MNKLVVLVSLVQIFAPQQNLASDHPYIRSLFGAVFDTRQHVVNSETESPSKTNVGCLGCHQKIRKVDPETNQETYIISEDELTALRIEYIKNQILKKLKLKEKPVVSGAHLPKPVRDDENILPKSQNDASQSSYDDFYGKTTQAIVFPYEDQARCMRKIRYPSTCLPFKLPVDILASDLSLAELWYYKEPDKEDEHNQTFIISEVAHWDTNKSFQKTTPIAIQQTSITEGWLKVDVTQVIENWLEFQNIPVHAINIVCKTCGMDINESPISFGTTVKPFLVIHTHSQRRLRHQRKKRQINCTPGADECCRESLYISFAEIGWDDWIIHPTGYNAYFCKGSCQTAASVTLSASQHNSILQKIMYGSKRNKARRLELTPCCAATHFQPLQLFYTDNNKTITSKILSNMIVDACGCM